MWDGILNGCASVLYELAKLVGDWGLAIIIVTLIIRLLLFPLQKEAAQVEFPNATGTTKNAGNSDAICW